MRVRTFDLSNDCSPIDGVVLEGQASTAPTVKVKLEDGRTVVRKTRGLTLLDKAAKDWAKAGGWK
jgi:hypothetical protein